MNGLDILACDIQNTYLTAQCHEKIWTVAGPEFGSDIGKIFIIKMALYGLKSSGAEFRSLLVETLHELNYVPSNANQDVYMRPGVKPNVGKRVPTKCKTPMVTRYAPEMDVTADLKTDGIHYFQ